MEKKYIEKETTNNRMYGMEYEKTRSQIQKQQRVSK